MRTPQNLKSPMAIALMTGLMSWAIAPSIGLATIPRVSVEKGTPSVLQFVPPVLSNTPEEPGGRPRGGGSRGNCARYTNLTALVPSFELEQKQLVWGLTTAAQPTFWFYVPDSTNGEATAEFVLQDRDDNLLYETRFKLAKMPAGVISVPLPAGVALQPNLSYQWTFTLYCDVTKPSGAPFVQGSIRRVPLEPQLQQQIATAATPLDRAKRYAREGIWYDALTTLGNSLQQKPTRNPQLTTAWADLLKQVGLANIAQFPLVDCCRPIPEQRSGL